MKLRAVMWKNLGDQKEVIILSRELKWEVGLVRIPQCVRSIVEAMAFQQGFKGGGATCARASVGGKWGGRVERPRSAEAQSACNDS